MAETVKLGKNGEIVLPRRLRAALNLKPGDELEIELQRDSIVVRARARGLGAHLERLRRPQSPHEDD